MALQSFTITIGALTDAGNNGKNYVNNQPVYIKRTNGTLATIYRDLAGTSQITQDGISNVTNSKGQFTFFVEAGDYNAEYQSQVTPITVVGPDYFNSRIDETVNQIILGLSTSRGFRVRGTFAAGFTYELPNDVGLDANGNAWIYTDADALPFTVPAATTPSAPTYTQVTFNQASNISYSENGNVEEALRKRAGYYTLAEAQVADLEVGQMVVLTDRFNSTFVTLPVGVTPNGMDLIAIGSGKTLELVYKDKVNVESLGANGDGISDSYPQASRAIEIAKEVVFNEGHFILSDTIQVSGGVSNFTVTTISGSGMFNTTLDIRKDNSACLLIKSLTSGFFGYNFKLRDIRLTSGGPEVGTKGLELESMRFVDVENVCIDGLDSHGVFADSSVGDITDTSQVKFKNVQIEGCGGVGMYATAGDNAIQYGWYLEQCRIGNNSGGGALFESMVGAVISNSAFYYNSAFGLKIGRNGSSPISKNITIKDSVEFDTNDTAQIDLGAATGIKISQAYLIANVVSGLSFGTGIKISSTSSNVVLDQILPRTNPALTGLKIVSVESGAVDIVIRDTNYNDFISSTGVMYDINESSVIIDDLSNRLTINKSSFTVRVKDSTKSKLSATTASGYALKQGGIACVGFRNLDSIDLSVFAGSDILIIEVPYPCVTDSGASFTGSCVTSGVSPEIIPVISNGGDAIAFKNAATGAFITAGDLVSGSSSIKDCSVNYVV